MRIRVPASTTNFGSGFDTFGLALDLYNTFEFEPSDGYRVEIEGYGQDLPKDETNLLIRVYRRACERFGLEEVPIRLRQLNRVPTTRGLGSSATAIVGGVEICLLVHGKSVSFEEKLKVALEFEPHPDNLVPAFVGGFVICIDGDVHFVKMEFPEDLKVVLAIPEFELSTEEARSVLKREVTLEDCVFNIRRASLLIYALMERRYDLLSEAVSDRLHQPVRSSLIPGFNEVLRAGYREGAYGVFLSGAGPSVCALCSEDRAEGVGEAMADAFREAGVSAEVILTRPSNRGVHLT